MAYEDGILAVEEGQERTGTGEGTFDAGNVNGESDRSGSADARSLETGDIGSGIDSAGDSQGIDNVESDSETTEPLGDNGQRNPERLQTATMGDSETSPASPETEQYEMVSASQFDDAMQQVHDEIAVSNAIGIALVAALFAVFGAICVQTLVRSITWN